MLVRSDLRTKQVRMLSIPRDGWVDQIGADGEHLGYDKLAHSYANGTQDNRDDPEGGIKRTRASVENLIGIPVDYYIIIEIDGFQQIIDELGGITIEVEKRMKYHDRRGKLDIDLQPGVQRLNGEQAMGYARFRHDAVGDIGRMARQQKVIKAIIEEMQKPENLPRLPTLAGLLNKCVKTNMGADQLLSLTRNAKRFELAGIQSQVLPSYWNREPGHEIDLPGAGGMDAQWINPEEVPQYRDFLLDLSVPPPPAEAEAGAQSGRPSAGE
jgi:LCP family protein required for cell wall assembly